MIPFPCLESAVGVAAQQAKAAMGGPVASGRMHGATRMGRTIRRRVDVGDNSLKFCVPDAYRCIVNHAASSS